MPLATLALLAAGVSQCCRMSAARMNF